MSACSLRFVSMSACSLASELRCSWTSKSTLGYWSESGWEFELGCSSGCSWACVSAWACWSESLSAYWSAFWLGWARGRHTLPGNRRSVAGSRHRWRRRMPVAAGLLPACWSDSSFCRACKCRCNRRCRNIPCVKWNADTDRRACRCSRRDRICWERWLDRCKRRRRWFVGRDT